MPSLHLLNACAPQTPAVHCRRALVPGDALVLLAGALLAEPGAWPEGVKVYALARDTQALGLPPAGAITVIDDDQLVALTETHHPIVSWF